MKKLLFYFVVVLIIFVIPLKRILGERVNIEIEVNEKTQNFGISETQHSLSKFSESDINYDSKIKIFDVFSDVSGIYFTKASVLSYTVGPFSSSILKIRGIGNTPNQGILVLIDDMPLSMALWRHPLFDIFPLNYIENMEIIKGPSSCEFGNQSVGGVINITTKEYKDKPLSFSLGTMFSNYYTQDHFLNIGGYINKLSYFLSGEYAGTSGYRKNSDSYHQNYFLKLKYYVNENLVIGASGEYSDITFYNPGPTNEEWERGVEACNIIQKAGSFFIKNKESFEESKILIYTDSGRNKFFKSQVKTISGIKYIDGSYNKYENYGAKIYKLWNIFPGNNTKIGFDWQYFGGFFENYPLNNTFKKADYSYENDYSPYFLFSQDIGIFGLSMGLRYGKNTKWGDVFIPQFGFKIIPFKDFVLYTNISTGYKTPSFGEVLFSNYEKLIPENYKQYETGITHILFDRIKYKINFYQIEGENLLQKDPISNKLENTGFILYRGLENDVEIKILKNLKLTGNISYIDPREKTRGIAFLTGKAAIKIDLFNNLYFNINTLFAHDRFDENFKKEKLEDYAILNAELKYKTKINNLDTIVYLDVDNIFNRYYQVKKGYPAPPFLFKSGIVINY